MNLIKYELIKYESRPEPAPSQIRTRYEPDTNQIRTQTRPGHEPRHEPRHEPGHETDSKRTRTGHVREPDVKPDTNPNTNQTRTEHEPGHEPRTQTRTGHEHRHEPNRHPTGIAIERLRNFPALSLNSYPELIEVFTGASALQFNR